MNFTEAYLYINTKGATAMTVYSCDTDIESVLTCIYRAWADGKGHKNLRLSFSEEAQASLFDEYIHVEADTALAEKVMDAVNRKISPAFYAELIYCSLAFEPDTPDILYRMMLLGFTYGPSALSMSQFRDVMRFQMLKQRLGREIHSFREFLRFHQLPGGGYVAHIEPQSRVVTALAPAFADRMPSEHWMIVDDVHHEAIVHPKDSPFFLWKPNEEEFAELIKTEQNNDEYTDLWCAFFRSIAIEERANARCQQNFFPLWKRKHAVEFIR